MEITKKQSWIPRRLVNFLQYDVKARSLLPPIPDNEHGLVIINCI